ncbi:putative ATP-binding protein involved in virulence [Erwinia rhapontici]|uniref:AAA family ATPase n=1 Tax=Erwinia rhapontici TaxID=55212 RepID=UPI003D363B1C
MAFTRFRIDNLFCFKDAELNLSFSRPPVNSSLEGEYIDGYEKFYFKKVCILSGANASGKTSLGRVIFAVQQFLDDGDMITSSLSITDKTKNAYIEADFFQEHNGFLYRVAFNFSESEKKSIRLLGTTVAAVSLRKNDSCATATKRLDKVWQESNFSLSGRHRYFSTYLLTQDSFKEACVEEGFFFGYHFILSENEEKGNNISRLTTATLSAVLKTFDNTIKSVSELTTKDEGTPPEIQGYSITFKNNDKVILDLDGDITNKERLSRGTYEAVKISQLLAGVISDKVSDSTYEDKGSAVYYLDEKMAFTHTELEKIILTLIISKLCRYGQFFYTTHNYDILSLDLPTHSFTFTKRLDGATSFIDATDVYKKNDRNLLTYVKNDCFGTIPDVSLIEEILFED